MDRNKKKEEALDIKKIQEMSEELGVMMCDFFGKKGLTVTEALTVMGGATMGVVKTVGGMNSEALFRIYVNALNNRSREI